MPPWREGIRICTAATAAMHAAAAVAVAAAAVAVAAAAALLLDGMD